jgi:thioredoxin-dependent peroxiredoxin
MTGYPEEGAPAPDFALSADDGSTIRLSELRGRKVVLYFYPKDDTPGCTTQACELRDHIQELDTRGALVLGVSPDSVESHQKFRNKYELPFRLLADDGHQLAEQYGVWKEKNMYGRKSWGVERTTFVIDEQGRLAKILPRVKPAQHVEQVLGVL